jgi:hypothetical protein
MNALRFLSAVASLIAASAWAAQPSVAEFGWRAPLDMPADAALARVELPATALAKLQSPDAHDVRVFNAAGEPVPFAWIAPPTSAAAPEERTRSYPALPLFAAARSANPKEAMQVRIEGEGGSVWVRMDGHSEPAGARKLDSALFATQGERKRVAALDLQATLPANVPVRVTASTSEDLASWGVAPVRGRIFRFAGQDAPSNLRLQFDAPIDLKNRYLRLDWTGQDGVVIESITGVIASDAPAPRRVRIDLPAVRQTAADTIEIDTGFATPIAALALEAQRDNTLVPVRVWGSSDLSQPWRPLARTVVYRVGQGADRMDNPPVSLRASARTLRIQSTNGAPLAASQLRIAAEFDPPQLVFVASGAGPFVLAAGHREAAAAALPATTITGMLGERKIADLPLAQPGPATEAPVTAGAFAWVPGAPGKSVVLWTVLVAGVLLLGGVAWSLLRQMKGAA